MSAWGTIMLRRRDAAAPVRDWVFVAFVAFAITASSFTAVQARRYELAMGRLSVCAADADSACAAQALQDLRAIDRDNPRTHIADAQVLVLAGDPGAGERMLVDATKASTAGPVVSLLSSGALQLEPRALATLEAKTRGEVLVVAGDLAAARGQAGHARARWSDASALVDDTLLLPRQDRLSALLSASRSQLSAGFDNLLDASRAGDVHASADVARDLHVRVDAVPNAGARHTLGRAIEAALRAAVLAERRNSRIFGTSTPPQYRTSSDRRLYELDYLNHQMRLGDYNRSQARSLQEQVADGQKFDSAMAEASALFEQGMRDLAGTPATDDSLSPR